ncbi:MAG: hypothetical protein LBU85_00930 [Treponema sp.]|nr:hypothetical protein [Treponema sp.]
MMKFFLTMLLAAFFVSCDLLLDSEPPLEPDQFYAVDFTKNDFYKVRAKILAEGENCVIWAENSSGVTNATAKNIADKYDNEIRSKIVNAFGMKNISVQDEPASFNDILDYANWLAGKDDRKLTILLLDIKDGFKNPKTDPYTAGYFYSGNFYPRNSNSSNGCDMIYVDTNPGLALAPDQTYATFAHELQHLINFATTTLKRKRAMDTWIDEGLSSQAEHIYNGEYVPERLNWFINDKNGTIAKGNNFFVWDNHREEPNAILDEYSTVYLFFRWLYLQADNNLKSTIFIDIETSDLSDHRIITNVAKNISSEWDDWDTLLSSWLAANYYPANTVYGYKDSDFQQKYKFKVKPINEKKIDLYPGEGVYSVIKDPFTPTGYGTNIRYAGIGSDSPDINTVPPYTSNVLLTFNANTNKSATPETAALTGVSASVFSAPNSRMAVEAEAAQTETPAGPYVIDARDISGILGRNK